MSWSSFMIKDDLNDKSVAKIQIKNKNKIYNVILEMFEDNLYEKNELAFYIYGKGLNFIPNQKINIHNFEAIIMEEDFNDGVYQVWNILILPLFKEQDIIKDTITKAKYEILKVHKHYYEAKNSDNETVIVPLIAQHLAKILSKRS